MKNLLFLIALVFYVPVSGYAQSPKSRGPLPFQILSPQQSEEYGKAGKYGRVYFLKDPKTKKNLPHTTYTLQDPQSKFFVNGTTDNKGRTAFIRNSDPDLLKRLEVLQLVGQGDYSGGFVVNFEHTQRPASGYRYIIKGKKNKILWEGLTNEQGKTVIIRSLKPETIQLEVFYDEDVIQ